MTAEPQRWVIDASVGIKLFVPEVDSPHAQDFFNSREGAFDDLFVPDLFYVECANILWKYVRRFGYPDLVAQQNITALKNLKLKTMSSVVIVEKALDIALRFDLTAYDACYLALAEALKAPLITADQKLFKRFKSGPISVKWIGDFSKK